ncbi:MAG: hypothetical protein VB143_07370 [Burkholderia sp.]
MNKGTTSSSRLICATTPIEVINPNNFITNQWDLEPIAAMSAFKGMRARWKKPSATPEDFAQVFDRNGLPATAQRIREAAALV